MKKSIRSKLLRHADHSLGFGENAFVHAPDNTNHAHGARSYSRVVILLLDSSSVCILL